MQLFVIIGFLQGRADRLTLFKSRTARKGWKDLTPRSFYKIAQQEDLEQARLEFEKAMPEGTTARFITSPAEATQFTD